MAFATVSNERFYNGSQNGVRTVLAAIAKPIFTPTSKPTFTMALRTVFAPVSETHFKATTNPVSTMVLETAYTPDLNKTFKTAFGPETGF